MATIAAGEIHIIGARERNLDGLSLSIRKRAFTVISGPSGSGKSALAFHTLDAESAYRQEILDNLSKHRIAEHCAAPAVDSIRNLVPTASFTHHLPSPAPTETIASLCALPELLFRLFTNYGERRCPKCGGEIRTLGRTEIAQDLRERFSEQVASIEANMSAEKEFTRQLENLRARGFTRVRVGEKTISLDDETLPAAELERRLKAHDGTFALGIDHVSITPQNENRLDEALQLAFLLQTAGVQVTAGKKTFAYHSGPSCMHCSRSTFGLEPKHFAWRIEAGELASNTPLEEEVQQQLLKMRLDSITLEEMLCSTAEDLGPKLKTWTLPGFITFGTCITHLNEAGLNHLQIARTLPSLSRGELQILRVSELLRGGQAPQLCILDEPTLGLDAAAAQRLLPLIRLHVSRGNTVIALTNSTELIAAADSLVPLGAIRTAPLHTKREPSTPRGAIALHGVEYNNLKGISVSFPLAALTVVSGPLGAGKKSLVIDILVPVIEQHLAARKKTKPSKPARFIREALERVEIEGKVEGISAEPFVNAPELSGTQSLVVTHCGLFDPIRKLYAEMPLSRTRGYEIKTFSLRNTDERGDALRDVRFKGVSLQELLSLPIKEAATVIAHVPGCRETLELLSTFRLEHLLLGGPTNALSSGEFQRLQLVNALKRRARPSVYILNRPCNWLDPEHIHALVGVIRERSGEGHTCIAIENNTLFTCCADHSIRLGPGSGHYGGALVPR